LIRHQEIQRHRLFRNFPDRPLVSSGGQGFFFSRETADSILARHSDVLLSRAKRVWFRSMSPSELTSADVKQMAKLLDLQMAEVSGFDVLEAFRSRHIHVPVIVITAHDEPGTAEWVRSPGAAAYLKKPVDQDTLVAAIGAAISPRPDLLALSEP